MALGPNVRDVGRLVVAYVDKVLKGTKPGDSPVMRPTEFDFVINLKIPCTLLVTASASRVVERCASSMPGHGAAMA